MTFKSILFHAFRYLALRNHWLARRYFQAQYQANVRFLGSLGASVQATDSLGSAFSKMSARRQLGKPNRIAYVSPLPNDQSGIAKYSADLLPELSTHAEIVLIHPDLESIEIGGRNYEVKPPGWLKANHKEFDQVVYHIGNSPFHTYMLGLLEEIPGAVVLHDVFLSHLLAHEYLVHGNSSLMVRHLFGSHGIESVRTVGKNLSELDVLFRFPCSGLVVAQATRVFVYSSHAKDLIRQFYGDRAAHKTTVLKMPIPPKPDTPRLHGRSRSRAKLAVADNIFLVCCFGLVQQSKRSEDVLNAWLANGWHLHTDKQLVFVGGYNAADTYAQNILTTSSSLGPNANVRILGWVDDDEYEQYLLACDLAVQLRSNSRGETSAALLHTLAYGVPSIINAHGSMSEIPPNIVHQLPDNFSSEDLRQALIVLHDDQSRLRDMSRQAVDYMATQHNIPQLIAAFSDLLKGTCLESQQKGLRPTVWVDCTLIFLNQEAEPAFFKQITDALHLALQSAHRNLDVLPVCLHPDGSVFTLLPEVYTLPQGTLGDVFRRGEVRAPAPDLLLIDPRVKGLACLAIRHIQKSGVKVAYFKSSDLNTALKLSDQFIQGSSPEGLA